MIFRHIKARSDWLSALIWRKQLELEEDTTEKEDDDLGAKKKMNLDPEDQRFIDWWDGRKENFKKLFEKEAKSSADEETGEMNGAPHSWSEVGNSNLPTNMTSTAETGDLKIPSPTSI